MPAPGLAWQPGSLFLSVPIAKSKRWPAGRPRARPGWRSDPIRSDLDAHRRLIGSIGCREMLVTAAAARGTAVVGRSAIAGQGRGGRRAAGAAGVQRGGLASDVGVTVVAGGGPPLAPRASGLLAS